MQAKVTHITLEKLKRDAKRLSKQNGLQHTKNLEIVAQGLGFRSYHEASKSLVLPLIESPEPAARTYRIFYRLQKSRFGPRIMATEDDLREMYDLVHRIARYEKRGEEGILICLAYDLRLTFQGRRHTIQKRFAEELGVQGETLYGVDIDWPTFILYVKCLRTYTDKARPERKRAYDPMVRRFEEICEEGLGPDFGEAAEEIRHAIDQIDCNRDNIQDELGAIVELYQLVEARLRKSWLAEKLLQHFA